MSDKRDQEQDSNAARRPYVPPAVLSVEPLEAAAIACDDVNRGKSSVDGCGPPTKPLGS